MRTGDKVGRGRRVLLGWGLGLVRCNSASPTSASGVVEAEIGVGGPSGEGVLIAIVWGRVWLIGRRPTLVSCIGVGWVGLVGVTGRQVPRILLVARQPQPERVRPRGSVVNAGVIATDRLKPAVRHVAAESSSGFGLGAHRSSVRAVEGDHPTNIAAALIVLLAVEWRLLMSRCSQPRLNGKRMRKGLVWHPGPCVGGG